MAMSRTARSTSTMHAVLAGEILPQLDQHNDFNINTSLGAVSENVRAGPQAKHSKTSGRDR